MDPFLKAMVSSPGKLSFPAFRRLICGQMIIPLFIANPAAAHRRATTVF
jgi:hypothetical protein